MAMTTSYPVSFDVEYPTERDRASTLLRLIYAIPIVLLWVLFSRAVQVTFLALVAMLLFRKKYPRWWYDLNLQLTRFDARVVSYLGLLCDEYPSTDEEQQVHLQIDYPDAEHDLRRGMPLIKWLLAIPHYIVLIALGLISIVLVIIAWFTILFTGRYPRGMFDFVVGSLRWGYRVQAYMLLLTTDRYPPFSLK
jgi:hypothetical protein